MYFIMYFFDVNVFYDVLLSNSRIQWSIVLYTVSIVEYTVVSNSGTMFHFRCLFVPSFERNSTLTFYSLKIDILVTYKMHYEHFPNAFLQYLVIFDVLANPLP